MKERCSLWSATTDHTGQSDRPFLNKWSANRFQKFGSKPVFQVAIIRPKFYKLGVEASVEVRNCLSALVQNLDGLHENCI